MTSSSLNDRKNRCTAVYWHMLVDDTLAILSNIIDISNCSDVKFIRPVEFIVVWKLIRCLNLDMIIHWKLEDILAVGFTGESMSLMRKN
mgnify:CR=1 FL=1